MVVVGCCVILKRHEVRLYSVQRESKSVYNVGLVACKVSKDDKKHVTNEWFQGKETEEDDEKGDSICLCVCVEIFPRKDGGKGTLNKHNYS